MADVEFGRRIEEVREGAFPSEGSNRQRRHKFLRGLRQYDAKGSPAFFQSPDQIKRLVGCNPSADDKKDVGHTEACSLPNCAGNGVGSVWCVIPDLVFARDRLSSSCSLRPWAAGAALSVLARICRISSSMDLPWRAARMRSRFLTSSPILRTVRLAMAAPTMIAMQSL
jgi:hypothetical protein